MESNVLVNDIAAYIDIIKCICVVSLGAVGSVGVAISQGGIAKKACEGIAQNPAAEKGIRSIFTYGMILVEAAAIYCLFIALIILFK